MPKPQNQPTNADANVALEKLRARLPAGTGVQLKQRDGKLVAQTLDGKEVEPVVVGAAVAVANAAKAASSAPPAATPTAAPIGQTGYDRILELLGKPPVGVPGLPPPETGIPDDLDDWLKAFKEPLARMTVETAVSALQSRVGGYSRGRLRELYSAMTPAEVAAVMESNTAVIKKFADQKALEAAMIASTMQKVTDIGVSYLMKALLLI